MILAAVSTVPLRPERVRGWRSHVGDSAGAGVHNGRRAAHHPEGVANDLHHLIERRRHAADFVLAFHRHGQREVAVGGDLGDGASHAGDRSGDQTGDEQRQSATATATTTAMTVMAFRSAVTGLEGLGQILLRRTRSISSRAPIVVKAPTTCGPR